MDKTAKTIKVGESIYQITSETKITKAGKPATLEDGVVDEPVSGYVKPTDDGKMTATTVRFGAKVEEKGAEKKKSQVGVSGLAGSPSAHRRHQLVLLLMPLPCVGWVYRWTSNWLRAASSAIRNSS